MKGLLSLDFQFYGVLKIIREKKVSKMDSDMFNMTEIEPSLFDIDWMA